MRVKEYIFIAAVFVLLIFSSACAQQEKRIYIANDDHTDFFWTAVDETYHTAFLETIDYYLDRADKTENESPEYQSRWNCDGSYWLWVYEKNRSKKEFERLIRRIKDGHISVPLNALCVCLGGAPAEAVIRGMYYPGSIERRYDVKFPLAYLIENQTVPCGIASLWAGSGAKYSWNGICQCDTRIRDAWDREDDIYWWRGPDGSRILMKWNSMIDKKNHNKSIGGYSEARNPEAVVEFVDTSGVFQSRYPYNIIGVFGKGWDDLKTMTDEFVKTAKKKTNKRRKVIVSNEIDFFEDFEKEYGSEIPSKSCSFGNEWELYTAGMAEVTSRAKRAVEKLRSAEGLSVLACLHDRDFMNGRDEMRSLAWMNIGLFYEHDWGMVHPPSKATDKRIAWQKRITGEIENYVNTLYDDGIRELGKAIRNPGKKERFFVFNPLNWKRTDAADILYSGEMPVHVVNVTSGREVPSQFITIDDKQYLRILAEDVPSAGYTVYEIRQGRGAVFSDAASVNGSTLENDFYTITVSANGAVTSLIDKSGNGYELAKRINGRYINDLGYGGGKVETENAGCVSVTLKAVSPSPLEHVTRVTLFRNSHRIGIRNEITQNFGDTYSWAFSFDLSQPEIRHEEVGAVLKARLTTDGGDYSPRNARYDWLSIGHFADMDGREGGIILSNADCSFMQTGSSSVNELDDTTPQINILAGSRSLGGGSGRTGIPYQGGDDYFLQRFALTSRGTYNKAEAMKFALEHQNPFVTGMVQSGNNYPEDSFSLVEIDNPDVLLWALKAAEDGFSDGGIVARVWNMSDADTDFSLKVLSGKVTGVKRLTHIETPVEEVEVLGNALHSSIRGNQILTFSLKVSWVE